MSSMPKDEGVPNRSHGRAISFKDNTTWLGEIYASKEPLLPDEIWQEAWGYPDYEVSSKGRIRRADTQRLLIPVPRGRGQINRAYRRLHLSREENGARKQSTAALHSLVAKTFHGLPPSPDLEVAHLDGNNQNNRADNLRWVTHRENMAHQVAHGRGKTSMECNLTRLCPNAVYMIRHLYQAEGWKVARIAELADLDYQVVERIAKGKSRARDLPRVEYRPR